MSVAASPPRAGEDREARLLDHIHIPTPGDHYSPTTGSAVPTVIYEVARCHADAGGRTRVVVGLDTRRDRYPVGECLEARFGRTLPSRWEKAFDLAAGRVGMARPFAGRPYMNACAAIPRGFSGVLFVHNAPAALPVLRRRFPDALLCLWAHNDLFRTYTEREAAEVVSCSDVVLCVSGYIAAGVRSALPARLHDHIRVVHNGADTERFRPALQAANDPVSPTILFLGRILPQKGPDLVLKALHHIRSEKGGAMPAFRVRIVGSSNFNPDAPLTAYERELRALAAPFGNVVEFVPSVDRKRVVEEYARGQIFCVPSNWDDPCPLTTLEGLACGLPMIAARRGGIPEIGGDAVLYFSPPDVERLAGHLLLLLENGEVRQEWGRRARARAEELCWGNQYVRLCATLSSIVNGKAGHRGDSTSGKGR